MSRTKESQGTKTISKYGSSRDDEPALLLEKHDKRESDLILLNEEGVVSPFLSRNKEKVSETNLW